jgi:2-polyprenyl-3-methyl-5-hydroxy-6-metoxy-1,4-benzoquinol methylase
MTLDVLPATDRSVSDAFAERTLQIINDGALALMLSIGHRTGLFDIMGSMPASSSAQIAAATGLSERYVREWLGAMVTGGIVTYDGATDTYKLPVEHASCLTRAASPNNVAVTAQWIGVLGAAEDAVVDAFAHGRGVPYGAYARFHEVMAEESQQTVVDGLLPHILPLADDVIRRLESGIDVLDIACGSGRAMIELAQAYPASRFTGIDLSPIAVSAASAEARRRGLSNVRFVQDDAAELSGAGACDLVTAFDAIHDQARPAQVLRAVFEALRPGGVFLMQDIAGHTHIQDNRTHPLGPFLYTISCMHCMSVSLAAGGPGLGAMWGREQALEMLDAAGFRSVRVQSLPHDPINIYYLAIKPARS